MNLSQLYKVVGSHTSPSPINSDRTDSMKYLDFQDHGGECCGMRHVFAFGDGYEDTDLILDDLQHYLNMQSRSEFRKAGILTEIVLTDEQLHNPEFVKELKRLGFRLVSRFRNTNSDNNCNILHYTPYPCNLKDSPFNNRTKQNEEHKSS